MKKAIKDVIKEAKNIATGKKVGESVEDVFWANDFFRLICEFILRIIKTKI